METRRVLSSRDTQVILLLLRILITRRAMIEMPSVIESCVISVVVHVEVSV